MIDNTPIGQLRAEFQDDPGEEKLWRKLQRERQYIALSPEPSRVLDYYRADPNVKALPYGPVSPAKEQELRAFDDAKRKSPAWKAQRSELVDLVDKTYTEGGGWYGINPATFIDYDPQTLRLLNADELGIDIQWVENAQNTAAQIAEMEADWEAYIDTRVKADQRSRSLETFKQLGPFRFGDTDARPREEIEAEVQAELDALHKEQARIAAGGRPEAIPDIQVFLNDGLNLMGHAINGLATGVGGLVWAIDGILPGSNVGWFSPYDMVVQKHKNEQEALRAQAQDILNAPDAEYMHQAQAQGAQQAWDSMSTERPDLAAQYEAMAGGDHIMAQSFFFADLQDTPEVQQQLQDIAKTNRDRDKQVIDDLAEEDFRWSTTVLDYLSMYGRNVPGRGATVFSLLLSDKDLQDELLQGHFADFWDHAGEEASALDFTPSAVFGIEGSMLGLVYDISAMTAFDPTIYFWGPSYSGVKAIGSRSFAEATALAKSPMIERMVNDTVTFARSNTRGLSSTYHTMSWMSGTGMSELMNAVGFIDNTLPARPWARLAVGRKAQETLTSSLRRLLPEEDIAAVLGGLDPASAEGRAAIAKWGIGDDILKNGFKEPVTITVSRADGTIHVTDGIKRILASEASDIGKVPATIKVVDDAAKGSVAIPHYTPEEAALIRDIGESTFDELKARAAQANPEMKFKPGADEKVRTNLLQDPAMRADFADPSSVPVGSLETRRGAMQVVRREEGEMVGYALVDDAGDLHSIVIGGKGTAAPEEFGIAADRIGGGQLEGIWNIAEEYGDKFVVQAASAPSMSASDDGIKFVLRYAKNKLKDATGVLRTKGVSIEDVFPDGLKKELRSIEEGAGEVATRPDSVLPLDFLLGDVPVDEVARIVNDEILRGARPANGGRSAIMRSMNGMIRDYAKNTSPLKWRSLMTQHNTTTSVQLAGRAAFKHLAEQTIKIWGPNEAKANEWLAAYLSASQDATKLVASHEAALRPVNELAAEVRVLLDATGGGLDDAFTRFEALDKLPAEAQASLNQMNRTLLEKMRELDTMAVKAYKDLDSLPSTTKMHDLVMDMWDDFNRTEIVPNWKKEIKKHPEIFDKEKGIVKWEHLTRGVRPESVDIVTGEARNWLPETLRDAAHKAGITDPEALSRRLNTLIDMPITANVPLSPLDLITASTRSGKGWTKWTQTMSGNTVRGATHTMHQAWIVDKVLRPATAATVSGDELLRIFHEGGLRAGARYVRDRLDFTAARMQAVLHGNNPLGRDAVRKGARYSPRVQKRLEALDYGTMKARQWERIFYDGYGNGWVDIHPGDPTYLDAAKHWTGGMLQQSGFREFLKGKDEFVTWFLGPDGQELRNGTLLQASSSGTTTGIIHSAEEAYKGWKTLFEDVILDKARKAGYFDEVMDAFRSTAARIDEVGGAHAIDLPDWVFDHMGSVRGVEKYSRKAWSPFNLTDPFFDRFFLDPVNYRRGFLADMVGEYERARLEGLYASQGLRVVSDAELTEVLGYKGLSGASRMGVNDFIAEQALRRGMVPESFMDDLVQQAVDAEVEHTLYVVDKASRAGNIATGSLFPFGKPYADMMGYWAKEALRRPHWRGVVNDENSNILKQALTAGNSLNPRTPALISRLAATNFNIDQGWTGMPAGETAGLTPGSESTNLSPLLFLPTAGENPFYSMLPGIGYLPTWGLDMFLGWYGEANDDPLKYQELLNTVGDVIGGAHFGNPEALPSLAQRFLGGGTAGQAIEAIMDMQIIFGDSSGDYGWVTNLLGQPDREIDRGRMMSAILSDPTEWEDLMALDDYESIDAYIDALAYEADNKAAKGNLAEQGTRFLVPANSKYSGELDEIKDVWLQLAEKFPTLAGQKQFNEETATPEQRSRYVDDVRGAFFDLPQWKRDSIVAAYPPAAVNLISTWDWTDKARNEGLGTQSYRTDGSREGLAKHDLYIKTNRIRPLSPQERARRIIGLWQSAKESTAAGVYESAASEVNDALWNGVVSQGTKDLLDGLLDEFSFFGDKYDIRTGRELWEAWGTYESVLEEQAAVASGVDPTKGTSDEPTVFDVLRDVVKVPTDEKPWGTSWPGLDPENVSNRFSEVVFSEADFTPQMREMADAVGVELVDGMNGLQLVSALQGVQTETGGALSLNTEPAYQTYLGERSAAYRVADENLRKIAFNPKYAKEWRATVEDFVKFEDRMSSRYRNTVLGMPASEQLKVQDRFMRLMNTADDVVVQDWQALWDLRYKRAYGPLGWEPPEPPSPLDDSGNLVSTAYQPFIKSLVDGDSIVVADWAGQQRYHQVRLLGVRARDYGLDDEGAQADRDRLWDTLQQALADGDRIYLVRQPDKFGNVDIYGRELAWLWIGDEPFSFPEEMLPNRDPSGGDG